MAKKRHFGNIRKRDSGRWQARYPGPDGRLRSAPDTFARKSDAERFLSIVEAQMARGEWIDPERAKVPLGAYATRWIDQRAGLRPRTVELYRWLLRAHIDPTLGLVPLGKVDHALVREWRAGLLADGVSPSATAKAYRLLRAVLNTATEDRLIARNPCQIRGADQEHAGERPVLSVEEVFALADAVPDRYRAMILTATFASLRFGEVTALRRRDVDLAAGTVTVTRSFVEVAGKGIVPGPPKSDAGKRTVGLPSALVEVLRDHIDEYVVLRERMGKYVSLEGDALIFTGPKGGAIRRGNFRKLTKWADTLADLGLKGVHFHDLRHTGNVWAARSGVSTRELMDRMGHGSMRAALIYQRVTAEADARIAAALDAVWAEKDRKASDGSGDGNESTDDKPDDDGDDGTAGVPALAP